VHAGHEIALRSQKHHRWASPWSSGAAQLEPRMPGIWSSRRMQPTDAAADAGGTLRRRIARHRPACGERAPGWRAPPRRRRLHTTGPRNCFGSLPPGQPARLAVVLSRAGLSGKLEAGKSAAPGLDSRISPCADRAAYAGPAEPVRVVRTAQRRAVVGLDPRPASRTLPARPSARPAQADRIFRRARFHRLGGSAG
jgi:hypothetical protein